MKIVLFGNNRLAWLIAEWLRRRNEKIVALVLHPPGSRKYGKEIMRGARIPKQRIFEATHLYSVKTRQSIERLKPDLGISILFGYLLPRDILRRFPEGCVNLHLGWFPYNRGAYPNVWSIVEGTPAGVTLHFMNDRIDAGPIIRREKVRVEAVDTGKSLYEKLERAAFRLFKKSWPSIRSRKVRGKKQTGRRSTFHRVQDVERLNEIQLDRHYRAHDLINLLRARTFPPYEGAYFRSGGKKVYLHLELTYADKGKKRRAGAHGKTHRN